MLIEIASAKIQWFSEVSPSDWPLDSLFTFFVFTSESETAKWNGGGDVWLKIGLPVKIVQLKIV